ncbi:MAG: hypothetical protein N3A66_07750 [Planctomycetota bacterium]|nr:hypothetical protein [Planctomycetota bacterium]
MPGGMGFSVKVSLAELLGDYKRAAKEAAAELRALEREAARAAKAGQPFTPAQAGRIEDMRAHVEQLRQQMRQQMNSMETRIAGQMYTVSHNVVNLVRALRGQFGALDVLQAMPGVFTSAARTLAQGAELGTWRMAAAFRLAQAGSATQAAMRLGPIAAAATAAVESTFGLLREREATRAAAATARAETEESIRKLIQSDIYGTRYSAEDIIGLRRRAEEVAEPMRGPWAWVKRQIGIAHGEEERMEAQKRQQLQWDIFARQLPAQIKAQYEIENLMKREDIQQRAYRKYMLDSMFGLPVYLWDRLTGGYAQTLRDVAGEAQAQTQAALQQRQEAEKSRFMADYRYRSAAQLRDRWLNAIQEYDYRRFLSWSPY